MTRFDHMLLHRWIVAVVIGVIGLLFPCDSKVARWGTGISFGVSMLLLFLTAFDWSLDWWL